MNSSASLSDAELRQMLQEYGIPVGPVTDTTREILTKKLNLLIKEKKKSDKQLSKDLLVQNTSSSSCSKDIKHTKKTNVKINASCNKPLQQKHTETLNRDFSLSDRRPQGRANIYLEDPQFPQNNLSPQFKRPKELQGVQPPNYFRNLSVSSFGTTGDIPRNITRLAPNTNDQHTSFGGISISEEFPPINMSSQFKGSIKSPEGFKGVQPPIFTRNLSEFFETTGNICENVNHRHALNTNEAEHTSPGRINVSPDTDFEQVEPPVMDKGKFMYSLQFLSNSLLLGGLLFSVLAILYVTSPAKNELRLNIHEEPGTFPVPVCSNDGYSLEECIEHKDLMVAVKLIKVLFPELHSRAVQWHCSGAPSAHMTHYEAYKWLRMKDQVTGGQQLEDALRALKSLLLSEPKWGITVFHPNTEEGMETPVSTRNLIHSGSLVVEEPNLPLVCKLRNKLKHLLLRLYIIIPVICFAVTVKYGIQWYKTWKEQERSKIFDMVNRIIQILIQHKKYSPDEQQFLVVNHVRDQLISPVKREEMLATWNNAVDWIKNSESRVRCEFQLIAGEEVLVWHWLPSTTTSERTCPNKRVQQEQTGDVSPTSCINVAHTFDPKEKQGIN